MPIPAGVSKIVIHAETPSHSEIAEWGFWVNQAPTDQATADSILGAYVTGVQNNFGALCSIITNDTTYTQARLYSYPTGGPASSYVFDEALTGGVGTSTYVTLPLQTSMCITLRTGQNGRSKRGRIYLPAHAASLGNTHLFTAAAVTSVVGAIAGALSTAAQASGTAPVVVSQTLTSFTEITSVDADLVPDIQRRRANKMPTTVRESAAVTTA